MKTRATRRRAKLGCPCCRRRRCRQHRSEAPPPAPSARHCGTALQTFLVGPKFKGVKMVPPGTHLVSYNASSGHGDFGPTTSFFLTLKAGQASRHGALRRARHAPLQLRSLSRWTLPAPC